VNCRIRFIFPQPEGFVVRGQENLLLFFLLKKSLYGLKQSQKCWNQVLHAQLMEMGFKQIPSDDPCIYISQSNGLLVCFNEDDILMAGKSAKANDSSLRCSG